VSPPIALDQRRTQWRHLWRRPEAREGLGCRLAASRWPPRSAASSTVDSGRHPPGRSPVPWQSGCGHGRRGQLLARDPVPLAARVESAARPEVAATTDAVPSRPTRSRTRTGPQF